MSMEPWRKRGFVPDSDEEDEFDSLEARLAPAGEVDEANDVIDLEYIPLPPSISRPIAEEAVNEYPDINNDYGSTTLSDIGDSSGVSDKDKNGHGMDSTVGDDQCNNPSTEAVPAAIETKNRSASPSLGEQTPKPRPGRRTYGKRASPRRTPSSLAKEPQSTTKDPDDKIWDIPSSPIEIARLGRRSRSHESTPKSPTPKQPSQSKVTIRPHTKESRNQPELIDTFLSRSSSPDELNVVTEPPGPTKRTEDVNTQDNPQQEGSEDDSPLSSPPSSLHSPPGDDPGVPERVPIMKPQGDIDESLTNLDVPPELLQQLSQPARRSFRERNAIQLHPYALELAKYQRLMRERGMKPIRPPAEAQQHYAPETTDESQEQDAFNPDAPLSSPPPEEFLRPERQRERDSTGQEIRHRDQRGSLSQRTQSHKRRKRSHLVVSPNHKGSSNARTRPQVVIQNTTPPNGRVDLSLFDVPSSPPDSSASRTPRASDVFRFPPGFTPPPTKSNGDYSKTATPGLDEPTTEEQSGLVIDSDESADSDASQSSAEPDENSEDSINRLMQRRIRGVLPASWVRIDAEQRLKQQKAAQQNRHAAQRADGKGIAKKIVRKPGQSNLQQGLIDLGDSDESNEENQPPFAHNIEEDAEQRAATPMGFDRDGDILEDNRIDYMLPTVPHAPREKRKNLKRVHSKEDPRQMERRLKKARLKRQTRLTDASYGGHRTKKKRTASVPRLGILDAPDVASKPRKKQPQFLRIAARGARSRRDGGRQSPTRKFLQLGSKDDTADANESLRNWRKGAIKQTKIARPQSKPRKSQSVAKPSAVRQAAPATRNSRISNHFAATEPVQVPDDDNLPLPDHPSTGDDYVPAAPPDRSPDAERSAQAERQGHQWIVRRNVAISSLQRNTLRPAATSLAGPNQIQAASRAVFGRSLTLLNRDFQRQASQALKPSLTLDRYISDTGSAGPPIHTPSSTAAAPGNPASKAPNTEYRQSRVRLKKRQPNHINLDADEFVQNQEIIAAVSDDSDSLPAINAAPARPSSFSFGGLFNWQRSYSVDFGVAPLRDGTFFHESTFIGSGELSRSLHISKRDLDQEAGFSSIPIRDRTLQCGAWNEKVSSEMGCLFDMIVDSVEKSATAAPETRTDLTSASLAYRSLINYVTEHLTFIDPVDRTGFVSRVTGLLFRLRDPLAAFITNGDYNKYGLVRFAYYNLVFANQIRQIASHSLVSSALADDALELVKTSAKDTLALVLGEAGIAELHRLFEETKKEERREIGIREEFPSAEAYVVVQQLLHSSDAFIGILDDIQLETCTKGIVRNQKDVVNLETAWRCLFTPLPLHEIDHHGIARREFRFKATHDNWDLVKRLLSPALDNYDTNSAVQPISYNAYCRTLFQRCHRLINMWGWRECRPVLDTLYDFFAQKTFYNLKLEESRGSPAFLDELDQNPSLDARAGEPCFHTLLKIIASGLRFLSKRYDNKKIRNFAWRLLPNHGRVYPKEKPLRHEDLDALRNHHDLLCTLYWAVPDGCRPRLETIRNLVHPASSHRETCSINIRSWARLVRFKLSTKEDLAGLDPFADWHSYFMTELRLQHGLARKEIETQSKGDERVSQQLVESAISQNQRQIESLLSMALGGMQTAVELAPSMDHAYRLISKTPFDSIMGLFNPKLARVNVVVAQALQVIVAYSQKDSVASSLPPAPAGPGVAASADEDSQEFGFGDCDWADIDAALVQQNPPPRETIEHVQKALHPVVSRLISNCFGADHCPEDAILKSALECWTSVAQVLVRNGLKHWDNYLSQFGDESWTRLRNTLQTRKFAPQFVALCIEKDGHILTDCRIMAMSIWISSLVERSSMLKFQHRLTEALMNGSPHDPLLQNLPFTKDKKSERYTITLEELSQRRLSLISSVLSNMREHVLHLEESESRDLNVTKHDYSDLLQRMMASMKDNYRELGNGAAESAQGAYVDFVHRIIRFLQELTSDIRPVDPFFTDPALFPLPCTDPGYIVAKLKRYEPKLFLNKEVNALTGFIQGIAERALVGGEQSHLAHQLYMAMKDTYEAGRPDKPTLRAVLLQCVFPAYLELSFSSSAAWLLSRPVILSISFVFKDLLFKLDATDPACVSSLLRIFEAVLQSSYRALRPLSNRLTRFKDPTVLAMTAAFIEMISASLLVVDYIDRVTESADGLVFYVQWFRDFAVAVTSYLTNSAASTGSDEFSPPKLQSNTSTTEMPQQLAAARRQAFDDHQSYLRNWSFHGGKYYYTRPGHDSKEIMPEADIAALVENESVARKVLENATAEMTESVERLGLLPPYEGASIESHGGIGDESTLSSIHGCLREQ
ncbi:uncharacterized protein N7498_009880 [Penicillium cinerascens]|uniref:Protein mms22 n=1 Tax=Penicillium cinerascens TaxID=70096 RepID=A0A9W9J5V1_9EURO|nr:uncharacterized protein N7498_009880 [Penicillium cinerascens]KAJ5190895.1 hypothetical protein N7498_009880 [Penicillium cinerascens]